jgi:hypothetical protein
VPTILSAVGLSLTDLFNKDPADPKAIARARAERAASEAAARERRAAERRAADIYRRLAIAVDDLGARLARAPAGPAGDALASVFHRACRLLAEIESALGTYGSTPALEAAEGAPSWSPFGPSPEPLEAARVLTEPQLLEFLGTGTVETRQNPARNGFLGRTA